MLLSSKRLVGKKWIGNALISSVQSLSRVQLFATPWTTAHQASLSITKSRSLLKLCPLSQWCHPIISSSAIPFSSCFQFFPASESFSNESALRIRWPKYWSFSFSISPSNEYSGLISIRTDWFDLLANPRDSQNLLQHHNSKASVLMSSLLYGPTLISINDYWKKHSFY